MLKPHPATELNVRRKFSSQAAAERTRNGESGSWRKVERSLAYMTENLNKPLHVAALAAQANVSPSHFFALFKQMTGFPPMDYFTKLRMRHACRLLDSTTVRVKEVAAALGYADPLYFSRVFKSVSAVAPVHYRGFGPAVRREIQALLEPKCQMCRRPAGGLPKDGD